MNDLLVIVTADPHRSNRALEALRMSVGLTLANDRVRVLLAGGAVALADPEGEVYPRFRRGREYLDVLAEQGAEIVLGEDPVAAVRTAGVVIRWDE